MSQLSQIQDALSLALQSDLENGVQWLNEIAWKDFVEKHPNLAHVLNNIQEMNDESPSEQD